MEFVDRAECGTIGKIGYIYYNTGNGASTKYISNLTYCNEKIIEEVLKRGTFASELYVYSGVRELNNLYKKNCPLNTSERRIKIKEIKENRFLEVPYWKHIKKIKGVSNIVVYSIIQINQIWLIDCLIYMFNLFKRMCK
jgi:hypothetical protein